MYATNTTDHEIKWPYSSSPTNCGNLSSNKSTTADCRNDMLNNNRSRLSCVCFCKVPRNMRAVVKGSRHLRSWIGSCICCANPSKKLLSIWETVQACGCTFINASLPCSTLSMCRLRANGSAVYISDTRFKTDKPAWYGKASAVIAMPPSVSTREKTSCRWDPSACMTVPGSTFRRFCDSCRCKVLCSYLHTDCRASSALCCWGLNRNCNFSIIPYNSMYLLLRLMLGVHDELDVSSCNWSKFRFWKVCAQHTCHHRFAKLISDLFQVCVFCMSDAILHMLL